MNFVQDPKENTPQPGDLIPYVMSGPNNPYLYNSIQVVHQPEPKPFGLPVLSAATFHVPNLPPKYVFNNQIGNCAYIIIV